NGVVDAVPCGYEGGFVSDSGYDSGYIVGDVYGNSYDDSYIAPGAPVESAPAVEAPPVPTDGVEPYVPAPNGPPQPNQVPPAPVPAPDAPPADAPNAAGLEK